MNSRIILSALAGITVLLTSCAGLKAPLLTGTTTAVGAAAGNLLSDGDVGGTALGAVVGYAAGGLMNASDEKEKVANYNGGYAKGRSDAAKTLYWAQRDVQGRKDGDSNLEHRFYQIPVPAHITDDGVLVEPHNRIVEIVE